MATVTYHLPGIGGGQMNFAQGATDDPTSITALAGGGYFITANETTNGGATWHAVGEIVDENGFVTGTPFALGVGSVTQYPVVAALANGGAVAAFVDLSSNDILRARVFDAHGNAIGNEAAIHVDDKLKDINITGLAGGGYVVGLSEYVNDPLAGDVHARIVDAHGIQKDITIAHSPNNDVLSGFAALSNGGFVASWTEETSATIKLWAARYDQDGNLQGSAQLVDAANTWDHNAQIVGLKNGGYAMAYINDVPQADSDIALKIFDSHGNLHASVVANQGYTAGNQIIPTITTLSNGYIAVGWTNQGAHTTDIAIFDQDGNFIYNPNGMMYGGLDGMQFVGGQGGHLGVAIYGSQGNSDYAVMTLMRETTGDVGTETLAGDSLTDWFFGNGGGDTISGGDGDDKLFAGVGDNSLFGGAGTDGLFGAKDDDLLDGGTGADKMIGYNGNDTYIVDNAGDEVIEIPGFGTDTVKASISYTLPDNVENLTLLPGAANGTGNALDNIVIGNAADNILNGGAGNDALTGGAGNDTLDGGGDNDTATYTGTHDQYTITKLPNGDLKIIDMRAGSPDGTDTVRNVEKLQFADATIDTSTISDPVANNPAPPAPPPGPTVSFDATGYHAVYADAHVSPLSAQDHYHQIGWHEGHDPAAGFDTTLYLIHNLDVAAAGVDPFEHYLQQGASEGRAAYQAIGQTITNGFDAEYYLWHNPDVAAAGIDPLAHYNAYGWHEGRSPNGWFDAAGYLEHYADVAAANIDPLAHYEQLGWKEGRDPSTSFDTLKYLAANPDVAAAGVNPLDHFLQNGIYEGRSAQGDGLWH